QLVEAGDRRSDRFHDRRQPRSVIAELEHLEDLLHDAVRAVTVGLVHDEEVRDLHETRLDGLNVVPHAGRQDDDAALREPEDLDLVLAHAHRLDEDHVVPRGVEHVHGVGRRARQSAEMAARRHRPAEHAASDGMGAAGSVKRSSMRIRSPRIAPPENGDDGSTATMPTFRPRMRALRASAAVSVDLPAPGEPVRPVTRAPPVRGNTSARSAWKRGSPDSAHVIARATAGTRPARMPSARSWTAPETGTFEV